ncbi:MAG: SLC13 family permease [Bdellovibrionota bacterium]
MPFAGFRFISPTEALQGFSSPAVITLGSMFIIAAGLRESGFADEIASFIVRIVGRRESLLVAAIMLLCGFISFFVNNIAVVALLLPTTISISHRTRIPASRLLIPLAYSAILGGVGTVIGTTPNILIVSVMQTLGYEPFGFFEFSYYGLAMLLVGTLFMAGVGRHLLPKNPAHGRGSYQRKKLSDLYKLDERVFSLSIPINSSLHGKSLNELRFAEVLGLQVITIRRQGKIIQAPRGNVVLRALDVLTVGGLEENLERVLSLRGIRTSTFSEYTIAQLNKKVTVGIIEVIDQSWEGKPVKNIQYMDRYGLVVTKVEREGFVPANFLDMPLRKGDRLNVIGVPDFVNKLAMQPGLLFSDQKQSVNQVIDNDLSELVIPEDSLLDGKTVKDASILEKLGISIMGIDKGDDLLLAPAGREVLKSGDKIIVAGDASQIELFESLGDLKISASEDEQTLDSQKVGIAEASLSPRSRLIDKTPYELNFRQKYGLQLLAIWREGKPHRTELAHKQLKLGDALLLQGSRSKINLLADDPDFLLLDEVPSKPRTLSRYLALISFFTVVVLSAFDLQPVHVAALLGALVAILGGAINIADIYRQIEWRILVLVAVLIAIGTAFQTSGSAGLIAEGIVQSASNSGLLTLSSVVAVLASLFSQLTDGSLSVVLLAPVVAEAAAKIGVSAKPLFMILTLGASIAFLTPFSHKANLLVLGAGGYKVRDYFLVGLCMSLITVIITIFLVPFFLPF